MKKVFAIVLALWAAAPCWAEDPAYTDINAEAYVFNSGIADRAEIERIHAWHRGLKNLQLYTNVLHMASFRTQHGAVSNSTDIYPMVGGKVTLVGGITQTTNGLSFTNSTADYAWFANPLGTNLASFTLMAAFASEQVGAQSALIGSVNWAAGLKGPQMFLHGSASAGSQPHGFYNYFSSDGSTSPEGGIVYPGNTGGRLITGHPQFAAFSWSTNGPRFVSGVSTNSATATNYATAWNMNTNFFLGRLQEAAYPLKGTIAFETVWNKNLNQYEIDAVRRLYSKTLGRGYIPENIVIYEGDSLTAGANTEFVYGKHLYTNSIWGPKVMAKHIAVSGSLVSGALGRITNSVMPLLVDKDYTTSIYYSLFIGSNDLGAGSTATTVFDSVKAIWSIARELGLKVIAWTLPPSGGLTAAADAQRSIFNNMLRQNRGSYDILCDLAATDPFRENSITNNTTYYQGDEIHFTSTGHKLLAEKLAQVINVP